MPILSFLLAITRLILFVMVTTTIFCFLLITNIFYTKKVERGIIYRRKIIRILHFILGAKITEYGKEPISIKDVSDEYPVIQCYDYEAYWHGNLCPKCKQYTRI